MIQKNLFVARNRLKDFEVKLRVTKGETEVGDEVGTCTLLYKGEITNRNPLYTTGRSTQCSVITYMGKKNRYMCVVCVCVQLTLHKPKTNTTL